MRSARSVYLYSPSYSARGTMYGRLSQPAFPFTDWQNDLRLNLGNAQGHFL